MPEQEIEIATETYRPLEVSDESIDRELVALRDPETGALYAGDAS